MKIGDRVFIHGYVDEIRKDTIIIRNKGGYFGTVPNEVITEPERKKGKWLFPYGDKKYKRCSVCERDYYSIPHDSNFCPNCGADMRGEK